MNELPDEQTRPLVDRPKYVIPKRIMKRPSDPLKDIPPAVSIVTQQAGNESLQRADTVVAGEGRINGVESTSLDSVDLSPMDKDHEIGTQCATKGNHEIEKGGHGIRLSPLDADPTNKRLELNQSEEKKESEEENSSRIDESEIVEAAVYYHESGDLFAEDIAHHMAVLPEMSATTEEVTVDDIQIGDPNVPITTYQYKLRSLIWKSRHLLKGKGNALPPAARGAICDIDVGGVAPIAQRVRPVAPT